MQPRDPNHAMGIDVSHYQGQVDWAQVKAAGKTFAFLKATDGTNFIDGTLQFNLEGCHQNEIAVGVYHFLRAATPEQAVAEAQFFCSVLDSLGGSHMLDLPPVLDVEQANGEDMASIAKAWLDTIEQIYKVKPILYSYSSFIDYHFTDLQDYPLWIAQYSDAAPEDHGGWSEWTFLQYSESGRVPGIEGYVDLDEFKGGIEEMLLKMNPTIAQELIAVCKAHYALCKSQDDKDSWHAYAEELRRVSGLPADE